MRSAFVFSLSGLLALILLFGCSQKPCVECNCTKKDAEVVKQAEQKSKPKYKNESGSSSCKSKPVSKEDYIMILTE